MLVLWKLSMFHHYLDRRKQLKTSDFILLFLGTNCLCLCFLCTFCWDRTRRLQEQMDGSSSKGKQGSKKGNIETENTKRKLEKMEKVKERIYQCFFFCLPSTVIDFPLFHWMVFRNVFFYYLKIDLYSKCASWM